MKIWIIWSSIIDLSLCSILCLLDCQFQIVLDSRFGPRWVLSWEDSLQRLELALGVLEDCDIVIVPPIYELHSEFNIQNPKFRIMPLFQTYLQNYTLPNSLVGKIGLVGYENHQVMFTNYRDQIIKKYIPNPKQSENKHFQQRFPLYPIKTNHRSICFDLQKSWFINKLIKMDLKKLKDYAIDSLLPLERWYVQFEKVFKHAFHRKIKFYGKSMVQQIITWLIHKWWIIWNKQISVDSYTVKVLYAGDNIIESNKNLMSILTRWNTKNVVFQKLLF